uniref:Uncharacterized protein n=1 Tax=Anopheles epiroticus TaxID=199890 RepID=A0A182PJS0_9DIPT
MVGLEPPGHKSSEFQKLIAGRTAQASKQLFDSFNALLVANFTGSGIKQISRYSLERAVNLQKLDLSGNGLEQLNANCFSGPTGLLALNLSYNDISSIDNMAFNTLSKLMLLHLNGNKLRALNSKVFEPLIALRTIYLNANELQVIESGIFAKNTLLQNILLQNNHISVIEEAAFVIPSASTSLALISLSNNNLTKLDLQDVKVIQLFLKNNKLEELNLSPWMKTVYADNNKISNVTISDPTNMQLDTLRLPNNSITSLESIQHFHSLTDLDLSNNHIGPLDLSSFAKLTKLVQLGLERTFISNLQHGTFAQQEALQWLDLSYNNLDRFDFDVLTSSAALQQIYLDGNRLKSLNYEHLKKSFPELIKIGLSDNNWNCTFLIQLVRYCTEHAIELFKPQTTVQNQTNVKGIYCYDDKNPLASWNSTLQQVQSLHPHLNDTTENGAMQTLLQNVLDDVRRFSEKHADVENQTNKLEGAVYDLTKNQFTLQKDLNSLRQSLFEIRLALMANRTNGSVGVDNDELRRMIETANNLTLDKQELSAKTLEFKIYEQTFKRSIYLDGNRLKSLNYEHLKKSFPELIKIGLSDNNWNCTFLIQLVRYCTEHAIELFKPQTTVQNQTNVKGIYCYDDKNPLASWNSTLQQVQSLHPHLNDTTENGAMQTLLQNVLDDVRRFSEKHADVENQTNKLEGAVYDLTKNQFTLQKDLNSLRQSLFEVRLSLMANRTNGSVGLDNDELRRMIETANNLTLDKQELSAKTLEFKIYEQTFKVDKALELAKENGDKIVVLAKRVEQWISNIVSSSGGGLLGQERVPAQQSATQDAGNGGNGNGVNIAVLIMLCVMTGLIVFGFIKFNRRSYGVE